MLSFSSSFSPLFLALFLIVSAGISYYFYRNSFISKIKKYILICLKTLGVFLLLALFIEPALALLVKKDSNKLNAILIDDSRSNILDSKPGEIRRIIAENNFNASDFVIFTYSNTLTPFISGDSLRTDGFETNLSNSLRNLKALFPDETFNSITIISDGIFNSGSNPLYEAKTFQAPVITVGIGDTIQKKDIVVSNVLYNEISYTNLNTKIKALLKVFDLNEGLIKVNLLREGSLISSKLMPVNSSAQNYEAEFDIMESQPGKVGYRVEAEQKEGELTYKNNYFDFYIEYTDNKANILFISGGPGADNALISNVLKRVDNYSVTYRTLKNSNEFYEGTVDLKIVPELSAVFLLNFPVPQYSGNLTSEIAAGIRNFKIPLVFFAGKNTDYQRLKIFDELIPFSTAGNSGETLFQMQNVISDENPLKETDEFISAGQMFRNISGIQPKPGAITLMKDKYSGEPVLITRNTADNKSTSFLGYGLWKWRLSSNSNSEKTLAEFLTETINLTLQKDKKTKFKIYPLKNIFDIKENAIIGAEVYDEHYVPVGNAKITGRVLNSRGEKIAVLNFNTEDNKYVSYCGQLPANEYRIEAEAELNGVFYSKDNSKFLVDSTNKEFSDTKSNFKPLRELAANTGGFFINVENSGSVAAKISEIINQNTADEISMRKSFRLRENWYVLMIVIMIFTIEWIVKKRNNIP
jgi:hypothetical protein